MPSRRALFVSLAVGLCHALGLLVVAAHLGYAVWPTAHPFAGFGRRFVALAVVAAVPTWLAIRYRLVTPSIALVLVTGYVLGVELTPPGPTFRDVAELERLAEPTGIVVVENGLYILRYASNASVWTLGFLLLGLVEYVVRNSWSVLPPPTGSIPWLAAPLSRRRAGAVATAGGLVHALVMVWFAARLGVTMSGGFAWALYVFGAVGMWVLAAIPLYLLVRHRVVAPATVLSLFVLYDVWSEFTAGVEGPHTLYFGGWFLFLGLLLLVAGPEYALRNAERLRP